MRAILPTVGKRPPSEPATWFLSRRLFLGGIAATYAIAFATLGFQVRGLFGSQGIAPLAQGFTYLRQTYRGWDRLEIPSILWLSASDSMLLGLCAAGVALAALAMLGILPRLVFFLLWAAYLSLARVGEPFLNFQGDALLLEAGFLSIFLAPGGLRPVAASERPPSRALLWLVRWLLFRLMFFSGLVKLASDDECWWDLTALDYHYWTQPLPHRLSHYAHWTPAWFHGFSVLAMFAIELGAPLLIFGPRRAKQVAAGAIVLLMVLITATGNYGFFDLLTAVLTIPLLDDRAWSRILRRSPVVRTGLPEEVPRWRRIAIAALAAVIVLVTLCREAVDVAYTARRLEDVPAWVRAVSTRVAPWESFNAYGLFRSMTRVRPELEIEGSADGVEWKPYRFRYKPLELDRPPVFAGLYMPRLDWQLWFAALDFGAGGRPSWYGNFLQRLLEGSPPVLALLAENPFPDGPPRFVRSTLWRYEFSSPSERGAGIWWRRKDPRPCLPVVTLEAGELRAVR